MKIGNIHPIQSAKANWQNASGKKKAAIVAGTVVSAAAIGATVYAAVKGDAKGVEGLKGIGAKLVDGYRKLGSNIAERFTTARDFVAAKLPKKVVEEAQEAADDVVMLT